MDLPFILRGLIIGFLIAAPVGPIGILCIKRSLSHGRLSGLVTGAGAATADGIYGIIAAFGLTAISTFLIGQKMWIQSIGILFLLYLGIKIFFEKPSKINKKLKDDNRLIKDYTSTFILTLTNPMTILSFIAVFAGLGLASAGNAYAASMLVLGVFLGSLAWWILLSSFVGLFRSKLDGKRLIWVNRISGIIIFIFVLTIALKLIN